MYDTYARQQFRIGDRLTTHLNAFQHHLKAIKQTSQPAADWTNGRLDSFTFARNSIKTI